MKKLAFGFLLAVMTLFVGLAADRAEAGSCYVFNNDLSYGMTFGEVLELQKFLAAEGSFTVELTGSFGPLTKSALAQYQSKNGIQATGYFGPATRAAVNADCGEVLGAFAQASTATVPAEKIKILEPRNSTTWQIEDTYPLSWYPSSNSANMDAFFEVKKGGAYEKVARLITNPGTAGSLSWGGLVDNTPDTLTENSGSLAKPGKYFVSIKDRVTGQMARTGSQVSVVKYGEVVNMKATAHPNTKTRVEAKEVGQTPITISDNSIVLSWRANADSCKVYAEVISELVPNETESYVSYDNERRHVTKKSFELPGNYEQYSVQIHCSKGPHTDVREFVVNVKGAQPYTTPILDHVEDEDGNWRIVAGQTAFLFGLYFNSDTKVYIDNDGDKYYFKTQLGKPGVIELLSIDLPPGTDNEFMLYAENGTKVSRPIQVEYRQPVVPASLTVVSPNGGEAFVTGSDVIKIKGQLSGVDDGAKVTAYLYHPEYGNLRSVVGYVTTAGSVEMEMNLGKGGEERLGNYKITLCADGYSYPTGKDLCDSSDDYFTIENSDEDHASCIFKRDLTLGSTGADVTRLQDILESKGFLQLPVGTTKGYFGQSTQTALARLQASVGISPATGYFGPLERAYIAANGLCNEYFGGEISAVLASKDSNTIGNDDSVGQFDFELDVTAFNEDAYVGLSVGRGTSTPGQAFSVIVLDGNNNLVNSGKLTFSAAAGSNETVNNRIRIYEGQTERFTLTAFYQPTLPGTYKIRLIGINYAETDTVPNKVLALDPTTTFTSAAEYISPISIVEARSASLTANTAAYSAIASVPNLSVGMSDPGVAAIQRYLNANGFPIGAAAGQPGSVGYESSYFGPATQAALARFQAARGISPANGSFGPQTRAAMSR